jgi:hypothetical protein
MDGWPEREFQRLMEVIKRGHDMPELDQELIKAKRAKDAALAELQEINALPVVMVHPAIADDYRARVAGLESAMSGDEQSRLEVIHQLRTLVDRIVLTPASEGKRGVEIEIQGRLAAMLALAADAPPPEKVTIAVKGTANWPENGLNKPFLRTPVFKTPPIIPPRALARCESWLSDRARSLRTIG